MRWTEDRAIGSVLLCNQFACKSACRPPHFVHLSRGFTDRSFVVSPAPWAANASNVTMP